jgi:hypothetical protein
MNRRLRGVRRVAQASGLRRPPVASRRLALHFRCAAFHTACPAACPEAQAHWKL